MSSSFPWLTVLGVVPLVGALLILVLPRRSAALARPIALATSLVALLVGVGGGAPKNKGGGGGGF